MADYTQIFTVAVTPNATKIPEKSFGFFIFFFSFVLFCFYNTRLQNQRVKELKNRRWQEDGYALAETAKPRKPNLKEAICKAEK